jgi:hypothetical protein
MKIPNNRPISPDEVISCRPDQFPAEVLESFNELLVENSSIGSSGKLNAKLMQYEILVRMEAKGLSRSDIFNKGWLNVEMAFRSAGWDVIYDKPGYNETYKPYFIFKEI